MKTLLRISMGLLCSSAALAGSVPGATCSPTLFIEASTYDTAGTSRALAVGDFDGDTRPDIAAASVNDRTVEVLLNDGNGGLGAPIVTPLDSDPIAIAAGDLRGNGTIDVVVATYSGIYVLLGHGDGTFDAPVFYNAELSNVTALVVGKFDSNGSLDVAVGSYYSDTIALFPGNGNGTFGTALHTSPTPQVLSLTSGDFNGDGHLDLAAATGSPASVEVFLGVGDGTFGAPVGFIAGAALGGIVSADFDGDGHADIAVGSGGDVSILLGNGAGGFQAALLYDANIGSIGVLVVGDVDQDGHLDIVAGEQLSFYGDGDEVSVLRGAGDGSFAVGEPYSTAGATGVVLADLDGDALPDVVTAGGDVSVLRDTQDGNLLAVPNSRLRGPNSPAAVAKGDWNGDGVFDFAWIYGNQVLAIEGQPGGRFTEAFALDMGGFSAQPTGVAAIYFSGDPGTSLVVSTYNDVLLFRSNYFGGFDLPDSIFNSFELGQIAVGDFDGTGGIDSDVVVSQGCCGTANLVVLLGDGHGNFQSPVQTPINADVYSLLPADFTRGFPPPGRGDTDDLAVATNGGVLILLGNDQGSFQLATTIPTPQFLQPSVAVGEFTTLGTTDLLVSIGEPNVRLYSGNNNGTFQPPITVALPDSAQSVTAGDYDDEPHSDFSVLTNQGVIAFLSLGNGHFESPIALATGVAASTVVSVDLTESGADGIAAIGSEGIAMFRNSRLVVFVVPLNSAVLGSAAVLHAHASGYGFLSYEWRKEGVPLSDGGSVSGSHTATLTIDPVSFADAGSYDVVVTDSCTSVTSYPAALSVDFADVPLSSPFHDDINTVATDGIAAGCGGGNYCPTSPVRRDQMAVFLLKSEHGAGYAPPACTGVFADVTCPSSFADWVEQLAAEGVTGGCGGGNYCPDASVTRAQMAVFLLKTSQGSSYAPPPATGIFGDVPVGSFGADFIEDLYNRGVTGGCQASPLLYCPDNSVLRQQMATFLVRALLGP